MPILHNPDWKTLKLNDFPQFKCLCELCNCGCFERSKRLHSYECKKKPQNDTTPYDTQGSKDFDSSTLYASTFKRYKFQANLDSDIIDSSLETLNLKMPVKYGPKKDHLSLPDKVERFSSKTTNKDHFKSWNAPAAKSIPEHPELAAKVMYPSEKRGLLTTNEELFLKNYGQFKSAPSSVNLFENTFQINQDNQMSLNTVYNRDYVKIDVEQLIKERGPLLTKAVVETRGQKLIKQKLPMVTQTQSMLDYRFDADLMKQSIKTAKESFGNDMFKSKLNKGLKPIDNDLDYYDLSKTSVKSDYFNYQPLGVSHLTHNKNIRFINSIDNSMVPALKVVKKMPAKKLSQSVQEMNKRRDEAYTANSELINDESVNSTYQVDFIKHDYDICMSKAYEVVSNKVSKLPVNSHVDDALRTNQQTLVK